MAAEVAASPVDDGTADAPDQEETGDVEGDLPRGHVGWVYTDVFKDLYSAQGPKPEDSGETGEDGAAGGEGDVEAGEAAEASPPKAPRPWETIDLSAEDEEIARIQAGIDNERTRIDDVVGYLKDKQDHALRLDFEEAKDTQARWSLTMREQIPVPDSKLRTLLDHGKVHKENLVAPRNMMANVERELAIRTGQILQHENLLSVSKPDAPNYLNSTGSAMNRLVSRNIQPRLTEAQRTVLAADIEERNRQRPPMPAVLNAEERAKNREIVKRMQTKVSFLKNPRFVTDRTAASKGESCPFFLEPSCVVFRNYEVGGVYEVAVELKNVTRVGRRVKVLPCKSEAFSTTPLRYDSEFGSLPQSEASAVVAPGLSARFMVQFAPHTLNDQDETVTISTEQGDWTLPIMARRVQPLLEFEEPVNCGCILAGQQASRTVLVTNRGGEGSFRLIPADESGDTSHQYETDQESGETTFVSHNFKIVPASFYLESEQSISLTVHFHATVVGQYRYPLYIEGDNGEKTSITTVAITDAVRLELLKWPGLPGVVHPRAVEPPESPWSLVPWQLNWLQPGVQVGCSESQAIVISNGGFLPMKLQWRFVQPPQALLSRLAVGGSQRLSDNVLKTIHLWADYKRTNHGQNTCPFTVSPATATLPPFSSATFTFTFYAHAPAGHRGTIFAYLAATELPASRYCLLHYSRLLQLQSSMQPDGYQKGLPLFGGAVGAVIDSAPPLAESSVREGDVKDSTKLAPSKLTSSCVVTAICLQGLSIAPSVTCLPPLLALSGDVLPFVAHTREVKLRNLGPEPAYFRFRLTSNMPLPMSADVYDTLWVVGAHEVAPRQAPPADMQGSDLQLAAERLAAEWPPLPPDGPMAAMRPGFGALATVAVEPHEGRIAPGSAATIRVTMRITQEADLDAPIVVDLPTSLEPDATSVAQPMKIRLLAAARSPRVEVRSSSFLDFGVVRAHSRHTLKIRIDNPSDLPTLVRLKHHHEKTGQAIALPSPVQRRPSLEGPTTAQSTLADGFTPRSPRRLKTSVPPPEDIGSTSSDNFPFSLHQEVVNLFIDSTRRGNSAGAQPLEVNLREPDVQPWVHARSGCMDESGRRPFQILGRGGPQFDAGGEGDDSHLVVSDDEDFIFKPECFALFPHQSTEVEVILRTRSMEKYNALVEILGFDSLHSMCMEAFAEVQLPRLRLSTQHAHFPVTYVKTASVPFELTLWNDSDMPAHFSWTVPVKLEACIECQIEPMRGAVPPRGSVPLKLVAVPTRESEHAELLCSVFVQDVMQPLALKVSARVYGPEVDYTIVPVGVKPPVIKHLPRDAGAEVSNSTSQVLTGKAPPNSPICDFGKMELLKTRVVQLVLYNRTGIATPYGVKIDKNPAWDPLSKGKKIGSLLEAATRMYSMATTTQKPGEYTAQPEEVQTFAAEPQAVQGTEPEGEDTAGATAGTVKRTNTKQGTLGKSRTGLSRSRTGSKFAPQKRGGKKERGFLLDDKHERQAFREEVGAKFAEAKEQKKQGTVALKSGRGYAVSVEPSSDWLQPFSTAKITLTCYSDVPGLLQDDLIVTIGQYQSHAEGGDYRIPVRLLSYGNPLYLPDQQVGLNSHMDPPRLLCETLTPVAKSTTRRFKVGNSSMTQVRLTWKVFPKTQVENTSEERQFVNVSLCGRGGNGASEFLGTPSVSPVGHEDDDDADDDDHEDPAADLKAAEEDNPPFVFQMWGNEPPKAEDPFALADGKLPVFIEPEEAILPAQGTATFVVTMLASKATATAEGHYHYKLVGKGRYTQDREALLQGGAPEASGDNESAQEVTRQFASKEDRVAAGVARLPEIRLDDEQLHDDDSDIEQIPSGRKEAERADADRKAQESMPRPKFPWQDKRVSTADKPLGQEPDSDVISTIVVDCVGDCILPRLTVDKKGDPSVREFESDQGPAPHCPVFKFTHSVVAPSEHKPRAAPGSKLGGALGGTQHQSVVSCLVRQITLSNENSCSVSCRFRVEGPFSIQMVSQAGVNPVIAPRPSKGDAAKADATRAAAIATMRQLFVVPRRDTITLQVEYLPEMVPSSSWTDNHEHVFRGDLVVEYPRDVTTADSTAKAGANEPNVDLQRIHLVATSRRPAMRLDVVPVHQFDVPPPLPSAIAPPWAEAPPVMIEFGYVHIESSIARKRCILLSNETNVTARWRLVHVGRKRRPPHEIGVTVKEDEDFRALDDKDAFEFDVTEGEQHGPTKDGLMPNGGKRMPRWCPPTPALPRAQEHHDVWKFEPKKVTITFKPEKNEVYKCRFRIQVDGGRSLDFICRGCGSYDEEDDAMEYQEA